jgi:hypothetical protein
MAKQRFFEIYQDDFMRITSDGQIVKWAQRLMVPHDLCSDMVKCVWSPYNETSMDVWADYYERKTGDPWTDDMLPNQLK